MCATRRAAMRFATVNSGTSAPASPGAPRVALLYAASWIPLVAIYAGVLTAMTAGTLSVSRTIFAAFVNALGPAAMGVAVWLLSGKLVWPRREVSRFLAVHVALSVAYALGWMAWEFLIMGPVGPVRAPDYAMWRYVLPWQAVIGFILYGVVAGASYAVRAEGRSRDLVLVAERAERLRAQAELAALRAHMNPHFFFNTLHSVALMLRTDPETAQFALEQLSHLFRYVLRLDRDQVELVTLEDEWEFTKSYLWLEQLRMGPRLVLNANIDDDALEYLVPPFTLQPLVENAVRHGLSLKRDGGTIRVVAGERDGLLHIEVTDDGVGTADVHEGSGGIGVRAVTQRLIAHFGDKTRTRVDSAPGRGYSVTLTFPAEASMSPAAAT